MAKRAAKASGGKGKVGSAAEAARAAGGRLDFGVEAGRAHPARKDVKSRTHEVKERARGAGQRVVGVGARGATPGKSGGEVDTDIIGVGTMGGSSVSTEGTLGQKKGRDLTTKGGAAPMGSGEPARGKGQAEVAGKVGGSKRVSGGTTHSAAAEDASAGAGGTGVGDMEDFGKAGRVAAVDPLAGGAPGRRGRKENRS